MSELKLQVFTSKTETFTYPVKSWAEGINLAQSLDRKQAVILARLILPNGEYQPLKKSILDNQWGI